MSEKLLRILLQELETIRVRCLGCKMVFEMNTGNIAEFNCQCPQCKAILVPPTEGSAFYYLSEALRKFSAANKSVSIEFVIPDKS